MKNFSLPIFIDGALFCAVIFFAARALTSLFISSDALSLTISAVIALAATFFASRLKIKRDKKLFIKTSEKKLLDAISAEFEIMKNSELLNWFRALFLKLGVQASVCSGCLKTDNGCVCYFDYSKRFTREKAAELLKKVKKSGNTVLFCNELCDDARALFKIFADNVYVAEPEELFSLMKKANYFYEPKILPFRNGESKKAKITRVLKRGFTKKRAAVFTLAGIAALAFSPFVFFKKYYIFYSLFCFIIAAACLFFGKKTTPQNRKMPIFSQEESKKAI